MARTDMFTGLLHRLLDVLWVEVLASDNDHILDAAAHKQPERNATKSTGTTSCKYLLTQYQHNLKPFKTLEEYCFKTSVQIKVAVETCATMPGNDLKRKAPPQL